MPIKIKHFYPNKKVEIDSRLSFQFDDEKINDFIASIESKDLGDVKSYPDRIAVSYVVKSEIEKEKDKIEKELDEKKESVLTNLKGQITQFQDQILTFGASLDTKLEILAIIKKEMSKFEGQDNYETKREYRKWEKELEKTNLEIENNKKLLTEKFTSRDGIFKLIKELENFKDTDLFFEEKKQIWKNEPKEEN